VVNIGEPPALSFRPSSADVLAADLHRACRREDQGRLDSFELHDVVGRVEYRPTFCSIGRELCA
jgi:hypothetical protein